MEMPCLFVLCAKGSFSGWLYCLTADLCSHKGVAVYACLILTVYLFAYIWIEAYVHFSLHPDAVFKQQLRKQVKKSKSFCLGEIWLIMWTH